MESFVIALERDCTLISKGCFLRAYNKPLYFRNPNGINGPELWKKYTPEKPYSYFKIDYPKSEMRDNFQDGRLKLFEDINKSSKKFQEIVYGKKL